MVALFESIADIFAPAAIVILGVFSLLDMLHSKGVPLSFYSKHLLKAEKDGIRRHLHQFYNTEYEYLKENEKWRIDLLLSQLTLFPEQKEMVKDELRKLSRCPINTHSDRQRILRKFCKSEPVCVNTDDKSNLTYVEVKYFLNFFDIMSVNRERLKISQIMANHVKEILKDKPEITNYCIVIPHRGNFLLGNEVSTLLRVPVVFMRTEGRIQESKPWDGSFGGIEDIIFIHDVTVTAGQIIEAVDNLPGKKVKGLFTLVLRTDKNAVIELKNHGIDAFPILKFNEESLRETIEIDC